VNNCAHAPFLSHPQECERLMRDFLHGIPNP
jgi:hypothetical protein